MNSLKNAIVTMTLLAVGYGAYVVLNSPTDGNELGRFVSQRTRPLPEALGDANVPEQLPKVDVQLTTEVPVDELPTLQPPQMDMASLPELPSGDFMNQSTESSTSTEPPPLLPPLPPVNGAGDVPETAVTPPAAARPFETPVDVPVPNRFQLAAEDNTPLVDQPQEPESDYFDVAPPLLETDRNHSAESGADSAIAPPDSFDSVPLSQVVASQASPSVSLVDTPPSSSNASRFDSQFDSPMEVEPSQDSSAPAEATVSGGVAPSEQDAQSTVVDSPSMGSPASELEASMTAGPITNDEQGGADTSNPAFERAWQTAQQQLDEEDYVSALATLSPWYRDGSLSEEQTQRCLARLDGLAGSVIYSRRHFLEPEYTVQAGETLDEIADRHGVPEQLLAKINGIAPPFALATGEKIKVVRGPFRAEVSLVRRELTLFLGNNYAGRFPALIGHDLPREEAFYEIAEKTSGRTYFDRKSGNEVMKGDAGNRYGNHWLGLRGEQITAGHSVGIHGRPYGAKADGEGSVSLDPIDAEDVFSILSVGSRIHVRR